MPRVAARNPLGAHPASLEEAVALDRLLCVARAGGLVAAAGGQPEEEGSVEMYRADSESLQFIPVLSVASTPAAPMSRVSIWSSSACETSTDGGRATSRMSHPG